MSFEYKASDFDVNVAKSGAADSPTWRLNKKPAAVTAPKLSMTEALQQITEQDRMVISRRSTFSSVFDHLW